MQEQAAGSIRYVKTYLFKMLYVSIENRSLPGLKDYAGLYCFKVGYNNIKQIRKGVCIVALHTIDTPERKNISTARFGCAHSKGH